MEARHLTRVHLHVALHVDEAVVVGADAHPAQAKKELLVVLFPGIVPVPFLILVPVPVPVPVPFPILVLVPFLVPVLLLLVIVVVVIVSKGVHAVCRGEDGLAVLDQGSGAGKVPVRSEFFMYQIQLRSCPEASVFLCSILIYSPQIVVPLPEDGDGEGEPAVVGDVTVDDAILILRSGANSTIGRIRHHITYQRALALTWFPLFFHPWPCLPFGMEMPDWPLLVLLPLSYTGVGVSVGPQTPRENRQAKKKIAI